MALRYTGSLQFNWTNESSEFVRVIGFSGAVGKKATYWTAQILDNNQNIIDGFGSYLSTDATAYPYVQSQDGMLHGIIPPGGRLYSPDNAGYYWHGVSGSLDEVLRLK